jgi:hypothetical protein
MKKIILAAMLMTSFQAFARADVLDLGESLFGGQNHKEFCFRTYEILRELNSDDVTMILTCSEALNPSYTRINGQIYFTDKNPVMSDVVVTGPDHFMNCFYAREALMNMSTNLIKFEVKCNRDREKGHTILSATAKVQY